MITGFNPADMYAVDHIRRVLRTFPGVFTGIGEFSIHKEFVSAKVSGRPRALRTPHWIASSISRRTRARRHPAQRHRHAVREGRRRAGLPDADEGAAETPSSNIDHLGPHRTRPHCPSRSGVSRVRRTHTDPARHRGVDGQRLGIRARELRHLLGRGRQATRWRRRNPLRVSPTCSTGTPIGSCSAPTPSRRPDRSRIFAVFDMWTPVWRALTPDASLKVRKSNYERIFNEGRRRVRAWEQANLP